MEEHKIVIVDLFNGVVRWLMGIFGVAVEPGKDVVPSHLVMTLVVVAIIIAFFKFAVKSPSMREPTKMQTFLESFYRFFQGLVDDVIGEEGRQFIPVLGTLALFIAISNLVGLMPEMISPTSNLNVTVGCAIFVFLYYHYHGIRKHGFWGYIKHAFMGPVWWLSWLFFPIEVVSHFSRPLSLSMRLFGNIFGEDLVIIIIASLVPFVAPLPVMALAVFSSLLQAFIFIMLSTIYLQGAISEEH